MSDPTRKGKIARLPFVIREELNRRLLDGQGGPKILPWVNALPETIAVCDDFHEQPVTADNLSEWRKGGYQDWLKKRARVDRTKELAQYAIAQAKADGSTIAEGAATIAAGQLLDVLETVDEATDKKLPVDDLVKIAGAIGSLRVTEQNDIRLQQNEKKLEQRAEVIALEREKFELIAAEKMLDKAIREKADEINASGMTQADKIAAMRREAFKDVAALQQSGQLKIPKV